MALVGPDNTLDEGMLLLIKKRKDDNDEWEAWSATTRFVNTFYHRTSGH